MIDLHTHTLLSDGELIASELARRAQVFGYKAIGIADHADWSNIDLVVPRLVRVSQSLNKFWKIKVIPGVEITHAPLEEIPGLVKFARQNGAKIVIVHGQTLSEPVIPGTNRVGIECEADILAHPGNITLKDAKLAKKKGVYLEVSAREAHSEANKDVVNMAREAGAKVILNTDAHTNSDFITRDQAKEKLASLGLSRKEILKIFKNSQTLLDSVA